MFEDSLMESQNRLSSPNQRWLTLASFAVQGMIAMGIVALPLLHPATLPLRLNAPSISLPLKPPPPSIPRISPTTTATTLPTSSLASGARSLNLSHLGLLSELTSDEAPPLLSSSGNMTGPGNPTDAIVASGTSSGSRVTLAPTHATGPIHISQGVSAGLLLSPIRPVYPKIAIAARVEGVVVIEAVISSEGRIEQARATNGPPLLHEAALDAVRTARYTPYRLNGRPTAVETVITVNFRLAG